MVDAAEGDAVGFERAGDEEDALGELAEQDDALTAETAGEEDEDGAGGERVAVFGGVGGLAGLWVRLVDVSGVLRGLSSLIARSMGIWR